MQHIQQFSMEKANMKNMSDTKNNDKIHLARGGRNNTTSAAEQFHFVSIKNTHTNFILFSVCVSVCKLCSHRSFLYRMRKVLIKLFHTPNINHIEVVEYRRLPLLKMRKCSRFYVRSLLWLFWMWHWHWPNK